MDKVAGQAEILQWKTKLPALEYNFGSLPKCQKAVCIKVSLENSRRKLESFKTANNTILLLLLHCFTQSRTIENWL